MTDENQEQAMNNPYKSIPVKPSEITPKQVYLSRREFIKAAGLVAGTIALAACAPEPKHAAHLNSLSPRGRGPG